MKMVILGAGASYDSVYEIYDPETELLWRPPLGSDLFEPRKKFREIFEKYEGLQTLYSSLNAVDDIEEYFQERWDFAINNNAKELLNSLINIQYALGELMINVSRKYKNIGLSNYDILVNEAYEFSKKNNEPILFVTFNYDLLLEYSIRKKFPSDLEFLNIDEYLENPLKIIKPHGSCNWFRQFKFKYEFKKQIPHFNELYRKMLTFDEIENMLENEILVSNSSLNSKVNHNGDIYNLYSHPQLLIPFKSKDSFILPTAHKKYLENNISKVDSILIIGWKGYEETFLNFLKDNIGEKRIEIQSVNICDKIIEERMKRYLPNANVYHFTEGLSETKLDSRNIDLDDPTSRFYNISDGSFSAYCLRIIKKHQESFFK